MDISIQEHVTFELSKPVLFLVLSASLRAESLNSKLASLTAQMVEKHGGKVDLVRMEEFDLPSYNQDIRLRFALPSTAFQRAVWAALICFALDDRREPGIVVPANSAGASRGARIPGYVLPGPGA